MEERFFPEEEQKEEKNYPLNMCKCIERLDCAKSHACVTFSSFFSLLYQKMQVLTFVNELYEDIDSV